MSSVSVTGEVLISTGYLSDQRFRFRYGFVCCLDEMIIYEGGDVIGLWRINVFHVKIMEYVIKCFTETIPVGFI